MTILQLSSKVQYTWLVYTIFAQFGWKALSGLAHNQRSTGGRLIKAIVRPHISINDVCKTQWPRNGSARGHTWSITRALIISRNWAWRTYMHTPMNFSTITDSRESERIFKQILKDPSNSGQISLKMKATLRFIVMQINQLVTFNTMTFIRSVVLLKRNTLWASLKFNVGVCGGKQSEMYIIIRGRLWWKRKWTCFKATVENKRTQGRRQGGNTPLPQIQMLTIKNPKSKISDETSMIYHSRTLKLEWIHQFFFALLLIYDYFLHFFPFFALSPFFPTIFPLLLLYFSIIFLTIFPSFPP